MSYLTLYYKVGLESHDFAQLSLMLSLWAHLTQARPNYDVQLVGCIICTFFFTCMQPAGS